MNEAIATIEPEEEENSKFKADLHLSFNGINVNIDIPKVIKSFNINSYNDTPET